MASKQAMAFAEDILDTILATIQDDPTHFGDPTVFYIEQKALAEQLDTFYLQGRK